MVKSIEKAVDEVVNSKKQSVRLLFTDGVDMLYDEVIGWSLNGDWVAIMLPDAATEVWPAKNIAFARHFTKE